VNFGAQPAVTVGAFDSAGTGGNPAQVRLFFFSNGSNYDRILDVGELRFEKSGP
jgi:hypothetical protein